MNKSEEYEIAAIPEWAAGFKADYYLVARCGEEHYFTRFPAFGTPATVEDWKVRLRA